MGGASALPQIDSYLHQVPPVQPHPQYPMYGNPFCGPMEPSFQSLGPTASNDQGPYGPYWHDGTYIPYQPAALRDPRYLPHHGQSWNVPQPGGWPNFNSTIPNINSFQQNQFALPQAPQAYNNIGRPSLDYTSHYGHRNPPEGSLPYRSA